MYIMMNDVKMLRGSNYVVNNCKVDVRQPFCQYLSFRSEGLPCKHILAITEYFYGGIVIDKLFHWDSKMLKIGKLCAKLDLIGIYSLSTTEITHFSRLMIHACKE